MSMKRIRKLLVVFSLTGVLSVGWFSVGSTISGAEVETPDQLAALTVIYPGEQSSQASEESAEAQQETVNSTVNNNTNSVTQQSTSTVSDTVAGTVSTNSNGTAVLEKAENRKKISLNTVSVNGTAYNITTVAAGALKDASDVQTVELGADIERIEKKAFSGADNLKKIKVNGTKAFRIEKGAFGKLDTSKIKVIVSTEMSGKEYRKLQVRMRNAGFEGSFSREK